MYSALVEVQRTRAASQHSKLTGPTSVSPWWSMTRAPQLRSMRSRVAGMLPPGSPATISTRTLLSEQRPAAARFSAATSASRSAYVGVQQTTVALDGFDHRKTKLARHAAAGHAVQRRSGSPASNAAQKPRNGPNENGKKMRSPASTRAPRYTAFQHSSSHCQLSLVSIQRSGRPVVDEVWQYRV